MSPSLSENVDRKEKLVEAYFYAVNETHAKNYSSSVIQELLFRDGGGKEVGHYIKAKNSVELDQITLALQILLKNYRLRIDRQARKDRNSNLNKWAIRLKEKSDEAK